MPFSASVEAWRSLLEENAGDLPVDGLLMGWIQKESGGNPCSLGSQWEVGIFQINLVDGPAYGASVESLRPCCSNQTPTCQLTDEQREHQVVTGVAYINHERENAHAHLDEAGADWPETSPDFWRLVKLRHALPVIPKLFLPAVARKLGRAPADWDEFRAEVESMTLGDATQIYSGSGSYWPFSRFFNNAEETVSGGTSSGLVALVVPVLGLLLAFV